MKLSPGILQMEGTCHDNGISSSSSDELMELEKEISELDAELELSMQEIRRGGRRGGDEEEELTTASPRYSLEQDDDAVENDMVVKDAEGASRPIGSSTELSPDDDNEGHQHGEYYSSDTHTDEECHLETMMEEYNGREHPSGDRIRNSIPDRVGWHHASQNKKRQRPQNTYRKRQRIRHQSPELHDTNHHLYDTPNVIGPPLDESYFRQHSHCFDSWTPKKLSPWTEPRTLEEKRNLYACGPQGYTTVLSLQTFPDYFSQHNLKKPKKPLFEASDELNQKIVLWKGDSTTLECDAIVNAANRSLLGGGGIDYAIHKAAGPHLKEECRTLHGCETGNTKITNGYKLPAKKVLHTVGPIGEDPKRLKSCYETCLDLARENGLKSLAFCCVSTGVYLYPLDKATRVALQTVREWLEDDTNAQCIDRIVFVVYTADPKQESMYQRLLPQYFPLVEYPANCQEEQSDDTQQSASSSDSDSYSDDSRDEESYFAHFFGNATKR